MAQTCRVRTSKQRWCNQRIGCLICGVVRIYDGDESLDLRKVRRSDPLIVVVRMAVGLKYCNTPEKHNIFVDYL